MSTKPTLAELQAYLDSPYQPPTPTTPQAAVHLFTDLNWQTECEPPILNTQLYHLLTITQQVLIGYYPDTHELTQPNPHYIAWAPLQEDASKAILWS